MMNRNDYKGWQIDPHVVGSADGWRAAVTVSLVAGSFSEKGTLTDEGVFRTKREAENAAVALARAKINGRVQNPSLHSRNASERLLTLQMQTYLLWEAVRHLREEAEAEINSRTRQKRDLTDPPYDLQRLIGGMVVLESGIHKAMDEVKGFYGGKGGSMFGEAWLRDMEDRLRREGEDKS
jgi:hypothetical protein